MSKCAYGALAGLTALSLLCSIDQASALTMKQCSEKYKAASEAGTVGGKSWNDFRAAECGAGATMAVKKVKTPSTAAAAGPSEKECSARYKEAKKAKTLNGMTWNEFRSAGCVTKAAAAPAPAPASKQETARTAPAAPSTAGGKVSEKECSARYQAAKSAGTLGSLTWNEFRTAGCPATMAKRSGSMTPTAGTIFPTGIAQKYSSDAPGRARLMTCRDQYEANKAAGITEPKWTEEGGGYYSECNKRLSQQ